MKHLMKLRLVVNMNQDGLVLLKMRSLTAKPLTAVDSCYKLRMNIQDVQTSKVIMLFQWTLDVADVIA
jgi:hypothetical protein